MGDIQPYLQFRLHEHPGLDAYVDSFPAPREGETRPTTGIPSRGNGTQYTYDPNRTPDAYLKSGTAPAYTALTDDIALDANHFSATRRANDISTWSVTVEYDGDDPRANELWQAAKNPTAFATIHITDPRDDMDVVNAFMEMDLFGGDIYSSTSTEPALVSGVAFPGPLDRAFSGPVVRVSPKRSRSKLELTIQGACWGKALQQTVHSSSAGLSVAQRTGVELPDLLRSILSWNSEYEIDLLDSTNLGTDSASGTNMWRTAYDQDALTTTGLGRTRTQTAFWGICFGFTADIDPFLAGRANTVFAAEEGQHPVLRSCQRLAERGAGLLFDTNIQCMPWYIPGAVLRPWGPEDYVEASMNLDRPEATSWLTKHNDYRRDWLIYVIALDLINQYGEIQTSNQSTAVRPLAADADPGSTTAESDQIILESIQAQDAGLALYEANRFSAQVGGFWEYPLRFGMDIGMGTPVQLWLNDMIRSDVSMDIRQAAFVWANNTWSLSYGLGAKADIIPRKRADTVEVSR